jgi:hypothetical protein
MLITHESAEDSVFGRRHEALADRDGRIDAADADECGYTSAGFRSELVADARAVRIADEGEAAAAHFFEHRPHVACV